MNEIIKNYEQSQIQQILKNSKVTDFAPGDTVKVNVKIKEGNKERVQACLLYTSPSPRDRTRSRMPSSA